MDGVGVQEMVLAMFAQSEIYHKNILDK